MGDPRSQCWRPSLLPHTLTHTNSQTLKVKSLSHIQLCEPVGCSPPGSPVHGIPQARILEWVAIPFVRGIIPTQGSNLGLPHCRQMLYPLSHLPFRYTDTGWE